MKLENRFDDVIDDLLEQAQGRRIRKVLLRQHGGKIVQILLYTYSGSMSKWLVNVDHDDAEQLESALRRMIREQRCALCGR